MSVTSDAQQRRRRAIGRLLVDLRKERTQTELGEMLAEFQPDGLPIPQTTISRWERGTVDLTLEQALQIEQALGVPLGTLARAGGYIAPDDSYKNVEDMLRVDPNLDTDFREDVIRAYRSYVSTSRRLARDEAIAGPRRRKRA